MTSAYDVLHSYNKRLSEMSGEVGGILQVGEVESVDEVAYADVSDATEQGYLRPDFSQVVSARVRVAFGVPGNYGVLMGVEVPELLSVGAVLDQGNGRLIKVPKLAVGDRVLLSVWGGGTGTHAVIVQRLALPSQSKYDPKPVENISDVNGPIDSVAPSDPQSGQIWYDTNTNKLKVWNGSQWKSLRYE